MGRMSRVGGIDVYVAEPTGEPRGAVVVIHEIWGLVDQIKGVADRWAAEGYVAVAPDIMSHVGITPDVGEELSVASKHPDEEVRTAMQPRLREALTPIRQPKYAAWAIARLTELLDWLEEIPGIAGRIAVSGFCFGGTYTFALAAEDDRVTAAVPFYGSPPEIDRIQDIECPVLAFYGEIDPPLMEKLPEVRAAMAEADIDFTDVVYPGGMHAFFNETNSRTYNADYAADAWAKATAFVADRLA